MSNQLHDRIRLRIEEMGMAPEGVAKKAGLDRSYFQKFFDRDQASPRADTIAKIARALGVSQTWLLTGEGDKQPAPSADDSPVILSAPQAEAKIAAQAPSLPARERMPNDVPVMGTAAGNHMHGAFQIEGGIIDYVRRPPALSGTREIYALYVEGTSMEPQFFPGDLIYVHPRKPARAGDAVVVQSRHRGDLPPQATIGIYLRKTEKYVIIRKHNPNAEVQILRNEETLCHKILTVNELFGV
jgi:phage repressor protein C with HTH and peptisase S24 domain